MKGDLHCAKKGLACFVVAPSNLTLVPSRKVTKDGKLLQNCGIDRIQSKRSFLLVNKIFGWVEIKMKCWLWIKVEREILAWAKWCDCLNDFNYNIDIDIKIKIEAFWYLSWTYECSAKHKLTLCSFLKIYEKLYKAILQISLFVANHSCILYVCIKALSPDDNFSREVVGTIQTNWKNL